MQEDIVAPDCFSVQDVQRTYFTARLLIHDDEWGLVREQATLIVPHRGLRAGAALEPATLLVAVIALGGTVGLRCGTSSARISDLARGALLDVTMPPRRAGRERYPVPLSFDTRCACMPACSSFIPLLRSSSRSLSSSSRACLRRCVFRRFLGCVGAHYRTAYAVR